MESHQNESVRLAEVDKLMRQFPVATKELTEISDDLCAHYGVLSAPFAVPISTSKTSLRRVAKALGKNWS